MKILICTPNKISVHSSFAMSIAKTFRALPHADFLSVPGVADVSLGRALADGAFRRDTHDVLLWIDSDQSWRPEDVEHVVAPIEAGEVHLVSALIARKEHGPTTTYAVDLFPGDCDGERGYVGPIRTLGARRYGRAKRGGTGFLACSRRAIEAAGDLAEKFSHRGQSDLRWLWSSSVKGGEYLGEDLRGTEAITAAGFGETWISLDAVVGHHAEGLRFGGDGPPKLHEFCSRLARGRVQR